MKETSFRSLIGGFVGATSPYRAVLRYDWLGRKNVPINSTLVETLCSDISHVNC